MLTCVFYYRTPHLPHGAQQLVHCGCRGRRRTRRRPKVARRCFVVRSRLPLARSCIRADALQRQYYNREVEVLIGSSPGPLVDLLSQRQWHTLPLPEPSPAAALPRAEPRARPPAADIRAATIAHDNPAVVEQLVDPTAATVAARMRDATATESPVPERVTRTMA